ncbi:MAG TPA: HAD-IA family hydrolase, partial [Fibrobacter sp.]|nr:HAD-IA family hydrolase [Fibrobacter sp.]
AILSNFDHYPHVYRFLDKTGLTPWVDEIVVSGEIRLKKPDAKIFEYTLKKLGLLPSEALMVGDDYEKDIVGAKNIGISTYFQKNGDSLLPILYLLEKGL